MCADVNVKKQHSDALAPDALLQAVSNILHPDSADVHSGADFADWPFGVISRYL